MQAFRTAKAKAEAKAKGIPEAGAQAMNDWLVQYGSTGICNKLRTEI